MAELRFLVEIRLYDDRWHGLGEWPPSPFRLFQALVAAACLGRGAAPAGPDLAALGWLEGLAAPVIAIPAALAGQAATLWVPNNDLDTVGGDPANVGTIRAGKTVRPRLLDPGVPFLYVWRLPDEAGRAHTEALAGLAERLYQFGRGVDMAYARAEILDAEAAEERLAAHPGPVWRPGGVGGTALRCPLPGTLRSLKERHRETIERLKGGTLTQARPARFVMVGYDCPPVRLLFELKPALEALPPGTHSAGEPAEADAPPAGREPRADRRFHPWPLARVAALARDIQKAAARRLGAELPDKRPVIDKVIIGSVDASEAGKAARVRLVPLPSIGSDHADPAIRRVLVEIPPDCPIRVPDLAWAYSGLDLGIDWETGEVRTGEVGTGDGDLPLLAPAQDKAMLRHYGIETEQPPGLVWHTVTPAVLPEARRVGRTGGRERAAVEAAAGGAALHAVRQALRHAGVAVPAATVRVQREPFFGKGMRAEAFAAGTRFDAARLWHVEIAFAAPVRGPLVLGDGRYCGLGLMCPVRNSFPDALVLVAAPETRPLLAAWPAVVRAVRRALTSLDRELNGEGLPRFSGQEGDGPGPARSGWHRHVYLLAEDRDGDGRLDRVCVVAPWRVDRSWPPPTLDQRRRFHQVVGAVTRVRAGPAGVLEFAPACAPDGEDGVFARSRSWTSRTAYRVTRHPRRPDERERALTIDLLGECERRGLPRPEIQVTDLAAGPHGGVAARVRLDFKVVIAGPLLLGRDAHAGAGLFIAAD